MGFRWFPRLQEKADKKSTLTSTGNGGVRTHPKQAVLKGDSKLIRFLGENPRLELYNLDDDIGEIRDIAKQHPDIVEVLQKLLYDEHVLSEAYPLPRIDDTEGKYSDFK